MKLAELIKLLYVVKPWWKQAALIKKIDCSGKRMSFDKFISKVNFQWDGKKLINLPGALKMKLPKSLKSLSMWTGCQ